jgi:UDP-N-acetylmuramoylalanine--D-glutamate ligase
VGLASLDPPYSFLHIQKLIGPAAACGVAPLVARDFLGFTGAMNHRNQRVTIMGLGHFGGGVAAARWLAGQGALVTVTDLANEHALTDALPLLADVPIAALHLGGHREEDFQHTDLVVVNPAVRPDSPWLQAARQSGARLCTELELFLENCPARIVGVTGSNGKSTTAAMIASILKAAGRPTFLGGNIGGSLLEQLPQVTEKGTGSFCAKHSLGLSGKMCLSPFPSQIGPEDWVVLEISSFQLWHFTPAARMPHVAVVTGCSPNHLDWHRSYADYVAAKQRLLTGQTPADFTVLNTFDPEVDSWSRWVRGRQIPLPELVELPPLQVPGEHNRINAACAAAAAIGAGCNREDIRHGLERFRALPQRLEWFAVVEGRRFYNDSTATTPESTIAALRSLDVPVWLLAGGKSKGGDFGPLAAEIVGRARGAAFFGSVRNDLLALTTAAAADFPCTAVETLEEALDWCWRQSRPGEAVVLSPACASTDQFVNFRQRGQRFVKLVHHLANPLNR